MGGDHKCPVCQATFTRPQHVARHMRSHTGDRPYKCQHCGDQFARSDLLSRHINKCHADEKPLQSTSNGRRKGSSSVTRATTSKQACDQCVQSSLPCDGANPCSKCIQRKCRCTYVKFHRQTAPVGPGHHPHPTSSISSRQPQISLSDEFILGPPPTGLPGLSSNNIYSHPFNFGQLYPAANASSISLPDTDFTAKYRAQAELLRRGADVPEFYAEPQATSSWLGWDSGNQEMNFLQSDKPASFVEHGIHMRRVSNDPSGSDGGSVSSSATSSSVHLPLQQQQQQMAYHADMEGQQLSQGFFTQPQEQHQEGGFSSAFGLMSLDDPNVLAGVASDGAPFFSSAALSMPPGDPNATPMPPRPAAIPQQQNHHHQQRDRANTFSFPATGNTPGSSSREAETRELREFWKAYMRTPLSGPGLGDQRRGGRLPSRPVSPNGTTTTPPQVGNQGLSGTSSMRTTLHGNADDLRSYEAAVLARRAPTTLNLAPRRTRGPPAPGRVSASASASPQVPVPAPVLPATVQFDFSRPSSSASTMSELARVFGEPVGKGGSAGSGSSRESSVFGGVGEDSEVEALRPSFKRLPSQTLGPANSKRVLISHSRGSENGEGRHRRMSAPGTTSPTSAAFPEGVSVQ